MQKALRRQQDTVCEGLAMRCPSCGHENPEHVAFCGMGGKEIQITDASKSAPIQQDGRQTLPIVRKTPLWWRVGAILEVFVGVAGILHFGLSGELRSLVIGILFLFFGAASLLATSADVRLG